MLVSECRLIHGTEMLELGICQAAVVVHISVAGIYKPVVCLEKIFTSENFKFVVKVLAYMFRLVNSFQDVMEGLSIKTIRDCNLFILSI